MFSISEIAAMADFATGGLGAKFLPSARGSRRVPTMQDEP